VAQVLSYRRSSGERRLQLKWLLWGSAIAGVGVALATLLSAKPGLPGVAGAVAGVGGQLGIPVCLGVAILKYRLFEINRIVSRTLAYAIVTALLVGVYAGIVLLATHVAAFAVRLKDAVDQDAIQADLASVVQQALEPVHVTVWTSDR
jgi:O-antigen/teichoic acid export membrane protein